MRRRFGKNTGLICGAAALVVSGLAARSMGQTVQLLTNTGFENPPDTSGASSDTTATAWTFFGGSARASFHNNTPGGQWSAWLQPYNAPGGVYQTYTGPVTAGSNYTLSASWFFEAGYTMTGTIADYQIDFLGPTGLGVGPNTQGLGAGVYQTNIDPTTVPTGAWTTNAGLTPLIAPAPAGATQILVEFDVQNFVTESHMSESAFVDDATLVGPGVSPIPQWGITGSGNWLSNGNWSTGNTPNGVDADAEFLGNIKANSNVYADTPITVGTLHFNNTSSYVIDGAAGAGSLGAPGTAGLTLQTSTGNAAITVDAGTQVINLPTNVASNTTITVASGAKLVVGNPMWINSGVHVTQTGSGTVAYNSIVTVSSAASILFGNSTHANTLSLAATATATIGGSGTVLEVDNLANSGTVNLQNHTLLINYGSGADPIAAIKSEIVSGYAGGAWTGAGIDSSAAAASPALFGIGYADAADPGNPAGLASGQIEVTYTLLGDANLDHKVNGTDFAILATDFNAAVTSWDQGDFNYDNKANGSDFAFLATNFNQGSGATVEALDAFAAANGLLTSVPEPASVGLLALAGIGALRRRRRS